MRLEILSRENSSYLFAEIQHMMSKQKLELTARTKQDERLIEGA